MKVSKIVKIFVLCLIIVLGINLSNIKACVDNYNTYKEKIEKRKELSDLEVELNELTQKLEDNHIKLKTEEEWQEEIKQISSDNKNLDKDIDEYNSLIEKQMELNEEIKEALD